MGMKSADFQYLGFANVPPALWLKQWSSLYPMLAGYDEDEYRDLIRRHETLTDADFERIGRWKDDATSDAKWKPNIASVAFEIWMKAAAQLPREPRPDLVAQFLDHWSELSYQDQYQNGKRRTKRFGLSRASTLLHFVSGGKYPIFDSRVITALAYILGKEPPYTIRWYLDFFCGIIAAMADSCGTNDLRAVDQALFCYGAFLSPFQSVPAPLSSLVKA
jgi:hypothetical protein